MDLKQLFTVGDSTSPSASQLWFHIVNLILSIIYGFVGYRVGMMIHDGVPNAPQLIDSLVLFTLVISGIITSNKFANMFVNIKYGKSNDPDSKTTQ